MSVYFMACNASLSIAGNQGLNTCTTAGYDGMASYSTIDERDALLGIAGDNTGSLWVGLSDADSEGTWIWTDGTTLSIDPADLWEPGQPSNNNNSTDDYDCAVMFDDDTTNDGKLYDLSCSESRRLTCSYRP